LDATANGWVASATDADQNWLATKIRRVLMDGLDHVTVIAGVEILINLQKEKE
jgi:hypothetical protein